MSKRSAARGTAAASSIRLTLRTSNAVATSNASPSRCFLFCEGSRAARSARTAAATVSTPPIPKAPPNQRRRPPITSLFQAQEFLMGGELIDTRGTQHRFAFARNGQATSSAAFRQALAAAGVGADTPATVLCDGDAGLWRLQREALPGATIVLDWWHAAVRFEHALQAARGLGAGTADASLAHDAVRNLDRAKWCLWHGRWTGCRGKLSALCRGTKRKPIRDMAGIGRLQRHVNDLRGYLERNRGALVPYAARRRRGEPISTAFVESAVNEIGAKRMNKAQQMRWNRATVQPFLDVRTAVLNDTLEDAFRQRYPGFRPANDDQALPEAA